MKRNVHAVYDYQEFNLFANSFIHLIRSNTKWSAFTFSLNETVYLKRSSFHIFVFVLANRACSRQATVTADHADSFKSISKVPNEAQNQDKITFAATDDVLVGQNFKFFKNLSERRLVILMYSPIQEELLLSRFVVFAADSQETEVD